MRVFLSGLVALCFGAAAFADDDFPTVDLSGRLMLDYALFDDDVRDLDSGAEVRRARLTVRGNVAPDWEYKLQADFANDGEADIKDAYLKYKGLGAGSLILGSFKQAYGLEEMTSSNHITFIERASPHAIVVSRRLGIGYQQSGDAYQFQVSLFGEGANSGDQEGSGVAARASWVPFREADDRLVHLGVGAIVEEPERNGEDVFRLRERPEVHVTDERLVNTGTLDDVDRVTRYGLEAATVLGRWSAQAEYLRANVDQRSGPDSTFGGFYAYVSYFLTDDRRRYKVSSGAFDRVKPTGNGAWEIGLRYSDLDLNDGLIAGGRMKNVTFGVNYYATSHLRFSGNLVAVNTDENAGDDDPRALVLRAQYNF